MSDFFKVRVECAAPICPVVSDPLQLSIPLDACALDNYVLLEHAAHGNHELKVYLGDRLLWKFVEEEVAAPVTIKLGCDQCHKEWVGVCDKEMITALALTFHTAHEGHRHWIGRVVGGELIKYGPVMVEQMPCPAQYERPS